MYKSCMFIVQISAFTVCITIDSHAYLIVFDFSGLIDKMSSLYFDFFNNLSLQDRVVSFIPCSAAGESTMTTLGTRRTTRRTG